MMSVRSGLREWIPAVVQLLEHEPTVVRIVVAEVRGSAPREAGAFMLVGRACVEGTIGGGRLEWESIGAARRLLDDLSVSARLNKVVLGADLGQCCGGVVTVWLERFTQADVGFLRFAGTSGARGRAVLSSTIRGAAVERRLVRTGSEEGAAAPVRNAGLSVELAVEPPRGTDVFAAASSLLNAPRSEAHPIVARDRSQAGEVTFLERLDDTVPVLWLYGAGHVGQALARILAELPLRLTWIDSRAELFPATVPEGVRVRRDTDSVVTLSDAPTGAYFLVMTHSHPLDFALCQAILTRNDFAWLGLIGSESKAARFRSRLARAGVPAGVIARLVCPIGVEGIESKWPTAIAVGVAAQVMQQISAGSLQRQHVEHAEPPRAVDMSPLLRAAADCVGESCANCGSTADVGTARTDGDVARQGDVVAQAGSDGPLVIRS